MKDRSLNIALIQSPLVWEKPEQNRIDFSKKISELNQKVDLVILPEMFTTGFTMSPQKICPDEGKKSVEWLQQEAAKNHIAIAGSIMYFENGDYTNRFFFVEPNGDINQYDKRHTFTLAGEDQVYKAGRDKLIVNYHGFKICPMICYDLRFPVWARNVEDYDVLIYVANWPTPRILAWDTLLKARAIENMVYCIGVNRIGHDDAGYEYPGHSAVYDCLGEQLVFSNSEKVLYATLSKNHISKHRNKLKFLEDRDDFSLEL